MTEDINDLERKISLQMKGLRPHFALHDASLRDINTAAPTVDYSPSDHSTLQVINLDELSKAAGVVVVSSLGVPKSLTETEGGHRNMT